MVIGVTFPMAHMGETDATRLSFPLESVIRIVALSVGTAATIWVTTSGLRSDVRDLSTLMRGEAEKRALQSQLVDQQIESLGKTVEDQKRRIELMQFEIGALKEMILKLPQTRQEMNR